MQNLDRLIDFYHIAFIVCIILAILFVALSVFLFYKFDILGIIDIKTGRGAQREIERMAEVNAQTGQLRPTSEFTNSLSLRNSEKLSLNDQVKVLKPKDESVQRNFPPVSEINNVLDIAGSEETTILESGEAETTILDVTSTEPKEEKVIEEVKEEVVEEIKDETEPVSEEIIIPAAPVEEEVQETLEVEETEKDEGSGETTELTLDLNDEPKYEEVVNEVPLDVEEDHVNGLFKIQKQIILVHSDENL